jgi:hypothetical protein
MATGNSPSGISLPSPSPRGHIFPAPPLPTLAGGDFLPSPPPTGNPSPMGSPSPRDGATHGCPNLNRRRSTWRGGARPAVLRLATTKSRNGRAAHDSATQGWGGDGATPGRGGARPTAATAQPRSARKGGAAPPADDCATQREEGLAAGR